MNDTSTAMRAEASACLSSLFLGILARGGVTFEEFEGLAVAEGNGKSHTAVALGVIACGMGYRVSFQHTAQLVLDLNAAAATGGLDRKMAQLAKCDMIILDEWGYPSTDPEGAKLLFRVISMCYERVSLVITTNIDFSRWGKIFYDEDMAAAMLDRVVHHGRLVTYERESYRMQHALMREGWCRGARASCSIGKNVHDFA